MIKECNYCEDEFNVVPSAEKYKRGKYCSRQCWRDSLNKTMTSCLECNKQFQTIPAKLKVGKSKYCGKECYEIGKMEDFSGRMKKVWITRRINGTDEPWNKGKSLPQFEGENNPSWKGGKWSYWKLKALLRDDYICQKCGYKDEEIMEVDHLLPRNKYPELEFDLDNLQTLCPNCHRRKTNREKVTA